MPSAPVIVLMGPTAAGKSAVALDLARRFDGEIINADSRQVYVGMDIGTAKPRNDEIRNSNNETSAAIHHSSFGIRHSRAEPVLCEGIPHYLINILTPDQRYSAAEFRDDARRIIADIHRRRKLPIVVGGTGFYARVLTDDRTLPNVPPDPAFRAWAERQPVEQLAGELQRVAPDLYDRVDNLANRRRVTRALEIARARWERESGLGNGTRGVTRQRAIPTPDTRTPTPWKVLKLALVPPDPILRSRLEQRVDEMLARGFVEEVHRLVARYGPSAPGLQSPGYRQLLPLLRGETTLPEARETILRAHWNVARRQRSWIRREPDVAIVEDAPRAVDVVEQFLAQ